MMLGKKVTFLFLFFVVLFTIQSFNDLSAFRPDVVQWESQPALEKIKRVTSTRSIGYDGVAIVTKVLWPKDLQMLKRWACLINYAYNDKFKYDFIVFTTTPWPEEKINELKNVTYPANLEVVLEGPETLEGHMASMTLDEIKFLRSRCKFDNETHPEALTWMHYCSDPPGSGQVNNVAYAWQAEFRAYHIWAHPALASYDYMMWLDADAMVGTPWDDVDPMQTMIENDLTVLYAGWPYGTSNNRLIQEKIYHAYNEKICHIRSTKPTKSIYAESCKDSRENFGVPQIAGNHHITNLNVFRKPIHQAFLKNFTGEYRFARQFDDQLAVTIVGIMEQHLENKRRGHTVGSPEFKYSVWHERFNNLTLKIAHHRMFDVDRKHRVPGNKEKFLEFIRQNWTGVAERCGPFFLDEKREKN